MEAKKLRKSLTQNTTLKKLVELGIKRYKESKSATHYLDGFVYVDLEWILKNAIDDDDLESEPEEDWGGDIENKNIADITYLDFIRIILKAGPTTCVNEIAMVRFFF